MSSETSERIGMIARAYWQPLVLTVMVLILLSQFYAWGSSFLDIWKVDTLIAEAKKTDSAKTADPADKSGGKPPNVSPVKPGVKSSKMPGGNPSGMPPGMSQGMPPGMSPNPSENPRKPKKNIFKKEEIPYQLTGIYMDMAIINGQTVKVGDRVGKAMVKEIAVSTVQIQEDGVDQPRLLDMFAPGSGGPPMGGPPMMGGPGGPGMMPGNMPRPGGKSPASPPKAGSPPRAERPNRNPPDMDQLRNMSPDERRAMIQNMSPEEREKLREKMRERGG